LPLEEVPEQHNTGQPGGMRSSRMEILGGIISMNTTNIFCSWFCWDYPRRGVSVGVSVSTPLSTQLGRRLKPSWYTFTARTFFKNLSVQ